MHPTAQVSVLSTPQLCGHRKMALGVDSAGLKRNINLVVQSAMKPDVRIFFSILALQGGHLLLCRAVQCSVLATVAHL